MSVVHVVRFPATIEQHRRAEELHPGLYERVIETGKKHGLIFHRRVFNDDGIMDIDEWESEEGMDAFRAEVAPMLKLLAEARGSGPPTVETWHPIDAGH